MKVVYGCGDKYYKKLHYVVNTVHVRDGGDIKVYELKETGVIDNKEIKSYLNQLRPNRKYDGVKCVYIIEMMGYYKIGQTVNLGKRLDQFDTATPIKTNLIHFIKTEGLPKKLEDRLHKEFASKRHKLEWFDLNEDDILYLKGM